MKKIFWSPEAMVVAGAAAVSAGVWAIYRPAGAIAGGLLLMMAGVALMLGGGDGA